MVRRRGRSTGGRGGGWRRAVRWGAAAGLVVALGLLGAVAAGSYRESRSGADAAVVLSAAIYGRRPSPVFEERIRHALALYRAGRVRRVLFTGGVGEGDVRAEASVARAWAVARGLPAEVILCEAGSRTTWENLLAARTLLGRAGLSRALLVSDPLHMTRALAMADEIGLRAEPAPTPTTRFTGARSRLRFLVREAYYLGGYLARRPFMRVPERWPPEGELPACD